VNPVVRRVLVLLALVLRVLMLVLRLACYVVVKYCIALLSRFILSLKFPRPRLQL
jgi:hypothetical protein